MTASYPSRPRPHGFTLTELLVVIALIAVLVSVLLAALGKVREKGEETETLATMRAFADACNAFQQEHGIYPGVVPEEVLVADADGDVPQLSGTENAILHLIGGFVREVDVDQQVYDDFTEDVELTFNTGSLGNLGYPNPYRVKIALSALGDGPVINGKPYAPYFAAGKTNLAVVNGQMVDESVMETDTDVRLPDLVDAWGQPIIYLRRLRSVGELTEGNPRNVQFHATAMLPYTKSTGLGKLEGRQDIESLFNTSDELEALLELILEHPSLPDRARGAFLLMSAGGDGIFLSTQDGAGSPGEPVEDLDEHFPDDPPPTIIKEYDDVIIFGGS